METPPFREGNVEVPFATMRGLFMDEIDSSREENPVPQVVTPFLNPSAGGESMESRKKAFNRLKPIDTFIDDLSALPQLQGLPAGELETLLCELHSIVRRKIEMDFEIEHWAQIVRKIRERRKSMRSIERSIEQAADRFDMISKELPGELEYLDDLACTQQDLSFYDASSETPFSDRLRDITQSLRRLREDAALVEAMIAGYVHPAVRTPNEKLLVESHDLASRRDDEYRFLKPKTPAVDLWFIGAAAACLRKCEYATHKQICGKEKII